MKTQTLKNGLKNKKKEDKQWKDIYTRAYGESLHLTQWKEQFKNLDIIEMKDVKSLIMYDGHEIKDIKTLIIANQPRYIPKNGSASGVSGGSPDEWSGFISISDYRLDDWEVIDILSKYKSYKDELVKYSTRIQGRSWSSHNGKNFETTDFWRHPQIVTKVGFYQSGDYDLIWTELRNKSKEKYPIVKKTETFYVNGLKFTYDYEIIEDYGCTKYTRYYTFYIFDENDICVKHCYTPAIWG